MPTRKWSCWPAVALVAGALAGCSGGGSNNNNNGNNPAPNNNAGNVFAVTSANRLVSFNSTSPSVSTAVTVTGLQAGESILSIDRRPAGPSPGMLYALGSTGRIYTLDMGSGMATLVSTMVAGDPNNAFQGLNGQRFSINFNNVVDQLRIISDAGQNLRVMVDNGNTFVDTSLTSGGNAASGIVNVTYTNNFAATCRNTAYYFDAVNSRLMTTVSASGGVLTPVGNGLGIQLSSNMNGLDIMTNLDGSNTALAAIVVNNTSTLYTINLMTGVAGLAGSITGLNAGETITDLAGPIPSSAPVQAIGELLALTESNTLVSFNSGVPQKMCTTVAVTGLQSNETIQGMDVRPSNRQLYALASTPSNSARIYTINPMTGVATAGATLRAAASDTSAPYTGLIGTDFAIDVSPVADALRVISSSGQNLAVLLDTGDTITANPITPTDQSAVTITSAAYTDSFSGTATSRLYVIDVGGGRLGIQGATGPNPSPNNGDVQMVGPLGIPGTLQNINSFEINAINNTALAALSVMGATTSDLYSINLSSGAASRIATIGVNQRIRGLTYTASFQATMLSITNDNTNTLVSFNPATPQSINTIGPVTGLQGGEKILGFDFRPANGVLYLLTDGGRVYTLNPTTAAATLNATLTPNVNVLAGANVGVDFSPAADALRVVSNAQQNLAIVVDTGQTITATPITTSDTAAPVPNIFGIAYNVNFPNPPGTVLYDIDAASNNLLRQLPANNGVVTNIGALGVTVTANGDMDIVGGNDGLIAAALQPTGATQSTLYRVNLATGALTAVGAIGPAGTPPMLGLAIQVR